MPPKENKEPRIENRGQGDISKPGVEVQSAPAAPEATPNTDVNTPSQSAAAPQPVQLPQIPNPPVAGSTVNSGAASPAVGNPAIADDVDVIEKEWVDQADKIVEQTKGDPYMEEEAIESLQIDYLKKRYGHDVKKPNDQGGA